MIRVGSRRPLPSSARKRLNILRDAPETPIKEAIRDAVFSRVRPIFMTMVRTLPRLGQRRHRRPAAIHAIHLLFSAHFPQLGHGSKSLDRPSWEGIKKPAPARAGRCLFSTPNSDGRI